MNIATADWTGAAFASTVLALFLIEIEELVTINMEQNLRYQEESTSRAKQKVTRYYDRLSYNYDDRIAVGPLKFLRKRERETVLSLADLESFQGKGGNTIDVGCGSGFYVRKAKLAGLNVTAVDLSQRMIEQVKSIADEAWVGDIENLKIKRTFDLVICVGVLEFVSVPERAFKNLVQLLAPQGKLVILVPCVSLGGIFYKMEKRMVGIDAKLYSLRWFREQERLHGLVLKRFKNPLPYNLGLSFVRPS